MKKWYILTSLAIVITLLLPQKAEAATTTVNSSVATAGTGESITASALNWTTLFPDEVYQTEKTDNSGDIAVTTYKWNLVQNIQAKGFTKGKYYNGYFNISWTTTPSNGVVDVEQPILTTTEIAEGVHAYIYKGGGLTQNITIVFDNYLATETWIGLPSIQHTFFTTNSSYNYTALNFTTTVNISSNISNLVSSDFPTTTGLCGQIWTALTNAIEGSEAIADIFATLDTIKQNDQTYYNGLLNQLTQSNTFLNAIDTYTQQIYNKVNNIDSNVTTILNDLEQYITFMRQYIPYLNNISTNTLNTYNQLVTILTYMKDRPTILHPNIYTGRLYININSKIVTIINWTNWSYIVIPKDQNISYIYMNQQKISFEQYEIFYFEEFDPTFTNTNKATRYYHLNEGQQYHTIDFKYNEKYVVISLTENTKTNFKAYIGDGYTYSALLYYIEMMEKMNAEQASKAAAAESAYNERNNQSETLIGGLNGVDRPTNNSGDFNILSNVDNTQKSNFFGMLGTITNTTLITKILLIIVTAAIAGYILYGKK